MKFTSKNRCTWFDNSRAKIPAERHSISINELTTDEKRELIKAMNHFRAVVSLFPRRLTMPN